MSFVTSAVAGIVARRGAGAAVLARRTYAAQVCWLLPGSAAGGWAGMEAALLVDGGSPPTRNLLPTTTPLCTRSQAASASYSKALLNTPETRITTLPNGLRIATEQV